MPNYDDYLAQQAEEYNKSCDHFNNETGRDEYCMRCGDYCTEYLESYTNDELLTELIEIVEYDSNMKNVNNLKDEILRRMKK